MMGFRLWNEKEKSVMKEFLKNCAKYWSFCRYSAHCQLNGEVVGMRLGWLWWLLEPALTMGIYTFVFTVVFGRQMTYLMAFISSGVMMWGFFQRTVLSSVGLVKRYSGLLNRVYMPKYILVISNLMLNAFKMMIAFLIVVFFLLYYKVPLRITMLQFIPVLGVLMVITFGISVWLMHFGVYLQDLRKVVSVLLQVLFYLSGVFYELDERLGAGVGILLRNFNPVAGLMYEGRNVLLYGVDCSMVSLGIWFVVGVIVSVTGVRIVTRYEKNYLKVI